MRNVGGESVTVPSTECGQWSETMCSSGTGAWKEQGSATMEAEEKGGKQSVSRR